MNTRSSRIKKKTKVKGNIGRELWHTLRDSQKIVKLRDNSWIFDDEGQWIYKDGQLYHNNYVVDTDNEIKLMLAIAIVEYV
jgi:hypothetical protein